MTDNEIIKALEYCYGSNEGSCNDCPRFKHKDGCVTMKDALDLINRQKAEIEKYKKKVDALMWDLPPMGGFHDD